MPALDAPYYLTLELSPDNVPMMAMINGTSFANAYAHRAQQQANDSWKRWQIYEFKDGALRLVADQDGLRA